MAQAHGVRGEGILEARGGARPAQRTIITSSGAHISRSQLLTIMGGVMLGLLLSSLDQTIVGPALFKIVKDLRGLEHYSWVTTGYLLTSTITVPIVGKLSDIYGRKWFFVAGMVLFVAGSALCGQSAGTGQFSLFGYDIPNLTIGMAQLILFRALQGIGGGMITGNAFTIIADLVAPAERGRWQGLFGAVFGLSSVLGPTIGGYLTDNVGWQWIFYVNLPIGIIAVTLVTLTFPHLKPRDAGGKRHIDWLGALFLTGAVTPILVALSLGGSADFPWDSSQTIGLFVVGGVLLIAFILREVFAKEPILPLDLFKNRIFTLSVVTMALVGIGMFGALINLPLFIQGVQGDSATASGNSTIPMMMSLIVVSAISGQILSRTGKYRILGIFGTLALTGGMLLLFTMTVDTPLWQTIIYMVIVGVGLGVAMPIYTVIVQNAVPVERLGVVTSATNFFRSIGGVIGVAVLGGVVNNRFTSEYTSRLPDTMKNNPQFSGFLSHLSPQALVSPDTITAIGQQLQAAGLPASQVSVILAAIQAPIKPALAASLTQAFLISAIIVAVSIVATALIPEIPLRRSNARPAVEGAELALGVEEEAFQEAAAKEAPVAARSGAPTFAPAHGVLRAAQEQQATGDMGELTRTALGLTLTMLAREVASPTADPRLIAALSDAVDGRYPHSWSADERAQAVVRDMVEPLARALLNSSVSVVNGASTPYATTLAPYTPTTDDHGNGRANGHTNGYTNGNGHAANGSTDPRAIAYASGESRPMKRVRVTRRLMQGDKIVGEQALDEYVPLDADTEAAAAALRARLEGMDPTESPTVKLR